MDANLDFPSRGADGNCQTVVSLGVERRSQCIASRRLTAWFAAAALAGTGSLEAGSGAIESTGYEANVPKAMCGSGDLPESGLQGQVPLAQRQARYKGASCNLALVSHLPLKEEPALQGMFTIIHDRTGHLCGFAAGRAAKTQGTFVADMTDPKHMVETAVLTTEGMKFSGEPLKANETRGLLESMHYASSILSTDDMADRTLDIYDIGTDCRHPKLLSSTHIPLPPEALANLRLGFRGHRWPNPEYVMSHESNFAPDGMTLYLADTPHGLYHAIDVSDPVKPKLLDSLMPPAFNGQRDDPKDQHITQSSMPHSLSLGIDGNRGYFSILAVDDRVDVIPQSGEWQNGFMVIDTSEIQARKPGGKMRFISQVTEREGGGHHGPNLVKINGHPYIIENDEFGTGQLTAKGRIEACKAGLAPNGAIRIWDMQDEMHPKLVSRLVPEVNDPKLCAAAEPETAMQTGKYIFLYDPHQCGVDNRENATVLACGYFQSGVRVYDIRDPEHVKEIAYYNPPENAPNKVSECIGIPRLDAETGMVYTYCSDNGFVALKFRKGIWPFPGSKTPLDRQL